MLLKSLKMNNIRLVLITSGAVRHDFFRIFISNQLGVDVILTLSENDVDIFKLEKKNQGFNTVINEREAFEKDYFKLYNDNVYDKSNCISIRRGEINDEKWVSRIEDINPDYIVSYGCSIVKSRLVKRFAGRFINLHLGLSPYYRGSGTNVWPIINKELTFIGATFMFIDEGIDTGQIIHQLRPNLYLNDNTQTIGNRVIRESIELVVPILNVLIMKNDPPVINYPKFKAKVYKRSHFNEEQQCILNDNIKSCAVAEYLAKKSFEDAKYPIVSIL